MRQRNDTGHAQDVMAWPTEDDPGRRPFTVGPGEEIDFPELLGGFTSLEPEPGIEGEPGPEITEFGEPGHVVPAEEADAEPAEADSPSDPEAAAVPAGRRAAKRAQGGEPQ